MFLGLVPFWLLLLLASLVAAFTLWSGFLYVAMLCVAMLVLSGLLESWLLLTGRLSWFGGAAGGHSPATSTDKDSLSVAPWSASKR